MKLNFESVLGYVCKQWARIPIVGGLGPRFEGYYKKRRWFQRFVKFGVTTTVIYWFVKGPLIWAFTIVIPNFNLVLLEIPSYLMAGFLVGFILTITEFVLNELWIWKKRR